MGAWVTTTPSKKSWVSTQPTAKQNQQGPGQLRKIVSGDIKAIKPLELDKKGVSTDWGYSRPVFKLTFRDDSMMVVKAEGNASDRQVGEVIRWGGKLMRQVTPQLKMQTLVTEEVQALSALPPMVFEQRTGRQYLDALIEASQQGIFVWVKMPFLPGLHGADSDLKEGGAVAEQLYLSLTRPSCLQMFGRILAIDLFIGNCDRVDPATGSIVNAGNIIFQKLANGDSVMIGLDYYESSGEMSNLFGPITPNWGGYRLYSDTSRAQFAQLVVDGLNQMFKSKLVEIEDFNQVHAWQIANGLREGIDMMHNFISHRFQTKNVPAGVRARAMKLDWYT